MRTDDVLKSSVVKVLYSLGSLGASLFSCLLRGALLKPPCLLSEDPSSEKNLKGVKALTGVMQTGLRRAALKELLTPV